MRSFSNNFHSCPATNRIHYMNERGRETIMIVQIGMYFLQPIMRFLRDNIWTVKVTHVYWELGAKNCKN